MKRIFLPLFASFALTVSAQEARQEHRRPAPPLRESILYTQGCPDCAQGLWLDGQQVGVIGWEGLPVPACAQVSLKGRNLLNRPVLLRLRYSDISDGGEAWYVWPRIAPSGLPFPMDSVGFTLPAFLHGKVWAACIVDGRLTNEVTFTIE